MDNVQSLIGGRGGETSGNNIYGTESTTKKDRFTKRDIRIFGHQGIFCTQKDALFAHHNTRPTTC